MAGEPIGCLGFLFEIFELGNGSATQGTDALPYRQRDAFLSAAELDFFHVLKQVAGQHFHVCAKVRISDLLYVVNRNKNMGQANRINQKHVDFVLCDPGSMKPKLVVELDDSSHQRADRQKRDQLVDSAFAVAGLPILHVICRRQYQAEDLKEKIRAALNPGSALIAPPLPESQTSVIDVGVSSTPFCPKCNIPMVQRTAGRGKHQGKRFWACPSYPDCRKIVAID